MSQPTFELPDTKNDALRALIATIETELAGLDRPLASGATADPLKSAWAQLVKQLDIGPAAESRACPTCKRLSRVDAAICSSCWTRLRP